jgi:hypothetical protein
MKTSALRLMSSLVLLVAADLSYAIDYFPTGADAQLRYGDLWVEISSTAEDHACRTTSDLESQSTTCYTVDANGDVVLAYRIYSSRPGGWVSRWISYSPQAVYLDFPLEAGKTWSSATNESEEDGPSFAMVLEGTVIGQSVVTVEAGTFDVIKVNIAKHYPDAPWYNSVEELWLHRQLGQVKNLSQWSGIVDAAGATWGQVKALYR